MRIVWCLCTLLLGVCAGCPLVALENATNDDMAWPVSADVTCSAVANAQGCPATAPGPTAADAWCYDNSDPNVWHPGATACYRGYGQNDGAQCCYDSNGCLIGDDDLPAAGTPDLVGPAAGELCDGTCDWFSEPWRLIGHWFFDVFLVEMGIEHSCSCDDGS